MLIINDKKGSYGYFSKIGINSLKENVFLLRNEKKKISEKTKSLSAKLFNNSRDRTNLEAQYRNDDFDIFIREELDKENIEEIGEKVLNIIKRDSKIKNKKNTKESNTDMNKIFNLKSKYFYHKNHIKKIKKQFLVPPCTKYNPKYDSILRKSASIPLWKSVAGRKEKKREICDPQLYLKHELIQDNMAGKTFIDFSKQTERKCFVKNNKENNLNKSMISNISNKRPFTSRNKIPNSFNKLYNKNNLNESYSSNDSYERFKSAYKSKILKKKMKLKK